MAKFYDHPETGRLHFQAISGGHGGGQTSVYDAPATQAEIDANPKEHRAYTAEKVSASQPQEQAKPPDHPAPEPIPYASAEMEIERELDANQSGAFVEHPPHERDPDLEALDE